MTNSPARARRPRRGFTVVELLTAMVIGGLALLIAFPRVRAVLDRGSANSAAAEVGATIESARAAALQRGRQATVRFFTDSVVARVDTGRGFQAGGTMLVLRVTNLWGEHRVRLHVRSPDDTLLVYTARGMATRGTDAPARYVLVRGAGQDSVCVSRLGMIMPRGCRL